LLVLPSASESEDTRCVLCVFSYARPNVIAVHYLGFSVILATELPHFLIVTQISGWLSYDWAGTVHSVVSLRTLSLHDVHSLARLQPFRA